MNHRRSSSDINQMEKPLKSRFGVGKIRALRGALLILIVALAAFSTDAQTRTFKHVMVILQENRTPDNVFGSNPNFEPGVDLASYGINSKGEKVPMKPISWVQCFDLNHSHAAYLIQSDGGKMDGADKNTTQPTEGCVVPKNPQFRYVDNSEGQVQPYFDIARQYGWANRMYQTNQGPSYAAHQFFLAGTSAPTTYSKLFVSGNPAKEPAGCTAPPDNTVAVVDEDGDESKFPPIYPCFEHPTLPDVLNDAKVTWKYYSQSPDSIWDAPNSIDHMCRAKEQNGQKSCTGRDWMNNNIIGSYRVIDDIKNCKLAQVSWVTPTNKESDHPKMTDGRGPVWVAKVLNALGTNPPCAETGEKYWEDTAIFITWDDWGGWYDHVAPLIPNGQPNGWGKGFTYGFRVPLLVVSAYTPAGFVENEQHDSGSLLHFVETNFASEGKPLGPIGPGVYADAYADDSLNAYFTLQNPRPFKPIEIKFNFHFFMLEQEDRGRQVFGEMARCGIGCWF